MFGLSAALPIAANLGMSLLGRKKSKADPYQPPPRPSYSSFAPKNDEADAEATRNFYQRRMNGSDTGLSPDDLGMLNASAIDDAAYSSREMNDRASARNRTMTGGVELGPRARDERAALGTSLLVRSKAMRDVGITNAVLKHDDQWKGAEGFDKTRLNERDYSQQRYANAMKEAGYDADVYDKSYQVNAANKESRSSDRQNFIGNLFGTGADALNRTLFRQNPIRWGV